MKKLLFSALLVMIPCMLRAQSESPVNIRYRGDVGLDGGVVVVMPLHGGQTLEDAQYAAITSYVQTVHGIEFNNAATLGLGLGIGPHYHSNLDDYEEFVPAFDFFLHFDYAFLQGKTVRPIVGARTGCCLSETILGPYFGVGGGIRIKDQWDIGLWYRSIIGFYDGKAEYLGYAPYFVFAWRFPGYKKPRTPRQKM